MWGRGWMYLKLLNCYISIFLMMLWTYVVYFDWIGMVIYESYFVFTFFALGLKFVQNYIHDQFNIIVEPWSKIARDGKYSCVYFGNIYSSIWFYIFTFFMANWFIHLFHFHSFSRGLSFIYFCCPILLFDSGDLNSSAAKIRNKQYHQ